MGARFFPPFLVLAVVFASGGCAADNASNNEGASSASADAGDAAGAGPAAAEDAGAPGQEPVEGAEGVPPGNTGEGTEGGAAGEDAGAGPSADAGSEGAEGGEETGGEAGNAPGDGGGFARPDAAEGEEGTAEGTEEGLEGAEGAETPDGGPASDGAVSEGTEGAPTEGTEGFGVPGPGNEAAAQAALDQCFAEIIDPAHPGPNYAQFGPIVGTHCKGTNHQDIQGIERVVFLGDSVTVGTPPTYSKGYRFVLADLLEAKFGKLDIASCAGWGDRTDDLLQPPKQQILECFKGPEPKRTLVVMTVGGNDMAAMAKAATEKGAPMSEILQMVDEAVLLLDEALTWFFEDPARFPNGVYIAFGNNYEYTDGTGDLESCPTAKLAGFSGMWPEGREAMIKINEEYMRLAVKHRVDMIFMLEDFCGHGFFFDDPNNQCYRGPGAEKWFDLTCIHPNPAGHDHLAEMFMSVVNE